jgi:hypothetical protein
VLNVWAFNRPPLVSIKTNRNQKQKILFISSSIVKP